MLYDINNLRALAIQATDGEIGSVQDVYFDDEAWTVRYLVVDTAAWLAGRKVLLSPISVRSIDWHQRTLKVDLTKQQIEAAPDMDTAQPVSRQYEMRFYRYYGYPFYWTGPYLWGMYPYPSYEIPREYELAAQDHAAGGSEEAAESDSHLRSAREVAGYHIVATDGELGHAETFLVDPASWNIRAVVVDTRNWLPGKHVLMPPECIDRVMWKERSIFVNVSRETLRASPEYGERAPVDEKTVESLLQLGRVRGPRARVSAL